MDSHLMKFQDFLKEFIPQVANKTKQVNKASWILEITGLNDAADLKADLDTELRLMFNDPATYQKLLAWDKEPHDPVAKRELNVLIRAFKPNQVPKNLLEELSKKEAALGQSYANFRPQLNGKALTENEIKEILKNENDPEKRKKAWEASKEIGPILAPQILALVELRNKCAKSLGYDNYFEMQLAIQEVDPKWLLRTFDELADKSEDAYAQALKEIEEVQKKRFHTEELGPWAWCEPFCQEDPLDAKELDHLLVGVDIPKVCAHFYQEMGIDVGPVLKRSDLFEREGKCQHAFCMNMDREEDVRTLNNIRPSIRWLETVLHELGHAIYELGFDPKLPWLLREPPHMITTEAMALIAGRQAYRASALKTLVGSKNESLFPKAEKSLKRRQLIFSRWVLVMSTFESELYRDPSQNLNKLWWDLVEKYQKIKRPKEREKASDWASKYHIGLAPVYYFSYLLGECFASSIQEALFQKTGSKNLNHPKAGEFLNQKIFHPGNRMRWDELVQYATGAPLTPDAWVKEFAT
jgi:peptidyl-dipeptidase A